MSKFYSFNGNSNFERETLCGTRIWFMYFFKHCRRGSHCRMRMREFPGIVINGVEATLDRLAASNMFFIAKRKHANQEVLYLSAKIPEESLFWLNSQLLLEYLVSSVPSKLLAQKWLLFSLNPLRLSSRLRFIFFFIFFSKTGF